MTIDSKKIDLFYDLFDEACMLYYEYTKKDYLECFNILTSGLIDGFYDEKLKVEDNLKIQTLLEKIEGYEFKNEEVRIATLLLLIKGFKSNNMGLDFITPDTIGYLFSYIINRIVEKENYKEQITVLDTCLGSSNLLQTVINNVKIDIVGVGIENDDTLTEVAKSFSLLLDNNVIINYNDALNDIINVADVVIGDFNGVNKLHEIILKRLDNLTIDGYFIYLVDNDFFASAPKTFKEKLQEKATLTGLILLPENFTKEDKPGKSIIIGKKQINKDYKMSICALDEINENSMAIAMEKINKMF